MRAQALRVCGLLAVTFALCLIGLVYLRSTVKAYWPIGVDVYPYWTGTRAFWQGENPYSAQVQAETQTLIYGRPGRAEEDPFGFYYPAYVVILMSPLVLFPVAWAGIIWAALMGAIFLTLVLLWSWSLAPRLKPLPWALVLFSAIAYRPALFSITEAQYGFLVLGCGALAWYLIENKYELLAGVLLMFVTIKPSLALFLPAVLLLWALRWKRWHVIIGFAVTLVVLMGITLLRLGWWIPDFLRGAMIFSQDHPGLGWSPREIASIPGAVWLSGSLIITGIGLMQLYRRPDLPWLALIGAMNLNLVLTPHLVEYDLAIMLLALFWLGGEWRRYRWGLIIWLLLIWTPWISYTWYMSRGWIIDDWWPEFWRMYPPMLAVLIALWVVRDRIAVFNPLRTRHVPGD
ncbi:MAG: glycosyltransferase 87 family protein [Anaerolineae bacterium]